MEKKVKDLTEEEVQAICDYYDHDCDHCILSVTYDNVCAFYIAQKSYDWKTAMRESIRCSKTWTPDMPPKTTKDIVVYVGEDGREQFLDCKDEQEAQQKCEELRAAFDKKFEGLL